MRYRGETEMSRNSDDKINKDLNKSDNDRIDEKDKLEALLGDLDTDAESIDEDADEEGASVRVFENKYLLNMVTISTVLLALYHIYAIIFKLTIPLMLYSIHWGMGLFLVYLYYPVRQLGSNDKLNKSKYTDRVPIYDILAMGMVLATVIYILIDPNGLLMRAARSASTSMDIFFGVIAIILSLEAARRTTGIGLPIVSLVFIAYALWGDYLPSLIAGKGYSFKRVVGFIFSI